MRPQQGGECELRASTACGFKYSSGADISSGGTTMSRPRYISAVLTLKPERQRRTEGEGRGAGQSVVERMGGVEEGAGREGEGKGGEETPRIHENRLHSGHCCQK